ncbi:MAG: DUF374 domain-containing protein [Rubripirellula sp.]
MKRIAPWLVGLLMLTLRLTCRLRYHNDPRRAMAGEGVNNLIAALHAEQFAGALGAEPGSGTMVSRSDDGQIVVLALRIAGHVPIRGSSGSADKGGATALQALIQHVGNGHPAMLAVDGPRGPRGSVQKGIGLLARKTKTPVLAVVAIPSGRWILKRTWDRIQIPKPFSVVDYYFSEPMYPKRRESLDEFAERVGTALRELEIAYDPAEGELAETSRATQTSRRSAA